VMIWIPMTAKDCLDTRLPIGFATHPYKTAVCHISVIIIL
jgi:hypothetical protein